LDGVECPACGNWNREGARFCDGCGAPLGGDGRPPAEPGRGDEAVPELPETVGNGRYRVERFLGEGGRKRVYLARDATAGREVAVAVFETEGIEETVLARARREAQAMGRLGEHPRIVSVYETGEDDGRPYIVSSYVPGGDVETLLDAAEARRLEVGRALGIAADVCQALEHAHACGVVHRDLKPANVWLDESGSARLGDFGLAATGRRSREAVEGMLVGTVAYLPPEQALGRASDPRADLYSLGGLLYEMLTGQPPFPGDDAVAIISQHLNMEPVAPSRHRPEIPRALDDLVLRLLAKSPDQRPESASAVRAELQAIAAAPAEPSVEVEPEENPLDRLAAGIFVGRERELDEMRGALEDTLAGRGRLLLLVGEPGIGKTRTAEELATYARVRGAKVHWGRCHEGEGAPPYWPWAQALRSYIREADPVGLGWELGQGAPEVSQLVPDVRERLGEVEEPPPLEPDQARFRLFDSISTFLANASRARPLVLVLDDLHWADEPSLLLLKFLARQLSGTGLLVVGAYRDVELGRHHPLAAALAELGEIEQTRRIALRGLDEPAIERFIEITAGVEPPPGLAHAVHQQTEGNPFFVGEVVRLLASEGRLEARVTDGSRLAIPEGVREVVGRRLDRLSPEANELLTLAAAVGREFDVAVLERVADRAPERIASSLAEAAEARIVAESRRDPGQFSFSHALVGETLYAEIPGPRRVQVHGEIAEALEDLHGNDPERLGELAHHFIEAAPGGDVEKAVSYAERAARRATDQLAHEAAVTHYQRALEALELKRPTDHRRRLGLLLALGEARTRAGRFVGARETLERAVEEARELGDVPSQVQAVIGITALSEAGEVDERIVSLVKEALGGLDEGDSAERARLLSGLAQELYWRDPLGEAARLANEGVEMARRLGDPRALAATLTRRQFDLGISEQERLETADELIELAERAGHLDLAARGHLYRLANLLGMGDVAEVDRELEVYARLAAELRQPQFVWNVPLLRAMRALMEGRFDEAEALAGEALALGQRAEEPLSAQFYAVQMALLHTHRGTVEEMLPAVRKFAARYPAIKAWRLALVGFLSESGRLDEAREEFERIAARDFEDLPYDAQWVTGMALVSRACWRLGDAARAQKLYELLLPHDGWVVVAGRAAASNGPVSLYLGVLALTMSRPAYAIRHFEDAIRLATRMGDRPFLAQSRQGLAAALLARGAAGDRERALELLGRVLETGQELGMRTLIEEALSLRLEAQGLGAVDVKTSIDTMISAVESERPDVRSYAAPDGTVTILFSDIENSTLMTERLGDERWIEVLRAHNSVFREQVRAHAGHEVKSQGDGFMLVFPDPTRALACAVAIQRALAEREVADGERIRVRMGLHAGEAIREEGDFFGRSVILAARIAAQARGGEILVSEALRELAPGDGGGELEEEAAFAFDGGRELELKGMSGTHRVFRTDWERQPSAA
jgi:predicted ATPase/class 3 adenylate cyclase